jgi:Xaa-Pro aminopeptidase
MNPYFDRKEYTLRNERAIELMHARGLGALFVTSDRNLYYLSGHQPVQPWHSTTRPTLYIAPMDGDAVLVAHEVWKGAAIRDTWIDDVRGYAELSGVPFEMVASLFQELGISDTRIGVELGFEQRMGISFLDFEKLKTALPGVEWVDASDLLWQLRSIKSRSEVACMRKACSAVVHAFSSVFPNLTPGLTQEQVVNRLHSAICDAGADPGFIIPVWDPESRMAMACLPTDRPIADGDFIWVDLGAVFHGYWCDFSRAVSLDKPTDDVLRTWQSVHEVTMKGVESIKPGVPICEVVQACADEAERQGLDLNFAAGRSGHGIGLMLTEPPSITLDQTLMLAPGMTITLEPGIVSPDGVYVVEQNVAVTEDGYELLSDGPWEIWVA